MISEFDSQLGFKIRHQRRLRGLTQVQLARQLDVSFQQLQKYEKGINKISFERLLQLSRLFGVSLESWQEEDTLAILARLTPEEKDTRQALALLQCYHAIAEEEHRVLVCSMARALAERAA